mmetsp:Transcript_10401/g.14687  ORF Transcript_10401/g.14687 Transcript_10401/m.14687 type:complete len:370 (+) Transcript_10401:103-1212(+)
MSSTSGDEEYWIYHERQELALCGQHALNNLVQACIFAPGNLSEIAHQLDEMELAVMAQNNEGGTRSKDYIQRLQEGSANVDEQGNFSIEVLRAALMNQYGLELPNIREEGVKDSMDVTQMEGFICNRDAHWFAIRFINGRFWNLNSTAERPEQISHFKLATEIEGLQNSGYSVFCVTKALPPPCTSKAGRERGKAEYWWKEEDLVKGKSNAITGASDPWAKVGSGVRLDGKPSKVQKAEVAVNTDNMTEDELMQFAIAASLEQTTALTSTNPSGSEEKKEKVIVPPEPADDQAGVCKIQFRLPDGKRVIRRFLKGDKVSIVYGFVEETSPGQGTLELRCGFPPKDLASCQDSTILESKLAGEMIQGRYT